MKFTSIEIEDIFAYRGRSHVDLSDCDENRNIVVVQGQNGFGKTSLLNAIKLLFLGSEDEGIRRVGFGGAALSRKHFVLGQPGRWYGVFNTEARGTGAPARVALEWEDDGRKYRAERLFFLLQNGADFREQLNVTINREPALDKEDAEAALLNLVPKEAVPYFFFDGEQIQSIADADVGRERTEIERLLGLSFVSVLTREIEAYSREKRRSALPETVQGQIRTAEAQQTAAETRASAAQRARVQLEEEILEHEESKRRLDTERNALRGGVSDAERKRTDSRIKLLQLQRERLGRQIAETLPVEAPALANLALTRRAFAMIEEQSSGADATLAARLHRELPDGLVAALGAQEPPIALSAKQDARFRDDVRRILDGTGVPPHGQDNPLFNSLSPRRLADLRDRFLVWDSTGANHVATQIGLLRQARQLAREEQQLRREIEDAEITSDESRARYATLTEDIEKLDGEIRERIEAATVHRLDEQRAQKEAVQHAQTVARLYNEHEQSIKTNAEYVIGRRAKAALERYREERRKLIRASVEAALNRRVQLLLGPSQLVRSVGLDNQFAVTYYDSVGELVARHSLSAGMRQLAAMAMLWALKDESHKPLPVVIDTPLGRIDRENRAILMTDYFPKAGNPLVLLPTNTELSEDDLAQLQPRIGRRYIIRNDGGQRARIESLGARA